MEVGFLPRALQQFAALAALCSDSQFLAPAWCLFGVRSMSVLARSLDGHE